MPYEAPRLDVVGSVHELTLLDTCAIINKQLGTPDLWANIPIEFCTGQGSV
jgi:hypothetical protein